MPQIRKPLNEIALPDLEALCRDKAIEDEQIDFKQTIPHKDGEGRDPWRDGSEIKQYGRDQLLGTVVAFANSYGGDLVIGVRDDGGKPGRAEELTPLRACEDAAHRLAQAAAELIEPPIPSLQTQCVLTEEDSGVIIIRVPRSRMAPHRLTSDRHCYRRVRHETKAMTMRQIQDLTFSVARGLEAVHRRLEGLRASFEKWADVFGPRSGKRFAVRVSGVPTNAECYLDRVHGIQEIKPRRRRVRAEVQNARILDFVIPFEVYNWHPLLRGTGAEEGKGGNRARTQLYCDGAVTYEFVREVAPPVNSDHEEPGGGRAHLLYPGWLFGMLVNALEAADRFRVRAGAATVEYAVDLEIVTSSELPIPRMGDRHFIDIAGTLPAGVHVYPRYALGRRNRGLRPSPSSGATFGTP